MRISVVMLVILASAPAARAQQVQPAFEAGAHFAAAHSSQFDTGDYGAGGRFAWRPIDVVGVEAELTVFPSSFPNDRGFSSRRLEGLFGATAGPRLGPARIFGRARPGFVKFSAPDQPIACIAIFPPPLSCVLAAGRTLFAFDLGGGVDVAIGRTTFVRIDAGDRMIRYPGTVIDTSFVSRDSPFFSHEFRFAAGGGIRF